MAAEPECWTHAVAEDNGQRWGGPCGPCWGLVRIVATESGDGERSSGAWSVYACEGHRRYEFGYYVEQPAVIALAELGRTGT